MNVLIFSDKPFCWGEGGQQPQNGRGVMKVSKASESKEPRRFRAERPGDSSIEPLQCSGVVENVWVVFSSMQTPFLCTQNKIVFQSGTFIST